MFIQEYDWQDKGTSVKYKHTVNHAYILTITLFIHLNNRSFKAMTMNSHICLIILVSFDSINSYRVAMFGLDVNLSGIKDDLMAV